MAGPLRGVKVIELVGIGPGPFCGMMLSDMGAEVLRIDRSSRVMGEIPEGPRSDVLGRGRRSVALDQRTERSCAKTTSSITSSHIPVKRR